MEQHAVPQDITGFKFKLVGDMTLKQFGELAGGALTAWLFYSTGWNIIIRLPLTIFFGLLGLALAFFPIEERPLDVWIFNFFRAIYRPTYYIWRRNQATFRTGTENLNAATTYSANPVVPMPPKPQEDLSEPKLWSFPTPADKPTKPALSIDELVAIREKKLNEEEVKEKPKQEEVKSETAIKVEEETEPGEKAGFTIDDLVKKRTELTSQKQQKEAVALSQNESKINELLAKNKEFIIQIEEIKNRLATAADPESQKKLDQLIEGKNQLSAEITALRGQITEQRVGPISPTSYLDPAREKKTTFFQKAVKAPAAAPTLSLTSLPNVINGLVTDEKGSPVDGAILIIKDQMGNSIRALKSNKVGQFLVSTPLENGTYYLELEKANLMFDTWEVTLTGEVLRPLEISAKSSEEK